MMSGKSRQLPSTLRIILERLLLFHLINLSVVGPQELLEKQTLKFSTILWILNKRRLRVQFSLLRHIIFLCLQAHQTVAAKVVEREPVVPTLSQSCASKLLNKSGWLKPTLFQMLLEKSQSRTQWRKLSSCRLQREERADWAMFVGFKIEFPLNSIFCMKFWVGLNLNI